jgi:putative tryptophan/tyrosine transport system substrate-binding protein
MRFEQLQRRQFITLLGGSAAAWPLAASAQQSGRVRRVGVLVGLAENDPEMKERIAGLREGLQKFGWAEGINLQIDYRFAPAGAQARLLARELIALQPDVILTQSTPATAAMQQETRTIPIVFAGVADPIGSGFVAGLPRPGGNLTGLLQYEEGITGKWLAMLKEIAPNLTRTALLANPRTAAFDYFLQSAKAVAPSLAIDLVPTPVDNPADIERAIKTFAGEPNGGLVLPPDTSTVVHRNLIIALAAQHRLPAVYAVRVFVAAGGLMYYGTDFVELYRQAGSYVDRILRGANPAELPVQTPTRFETVVNLKTAKALGLTVPPGLLVAADEVIE